MFGKKGFTLVEILFVLIIAAGILMYAVPSYRRTKERSQYEAAVGTLVSVGNAIQSLEQYLQSEGYTFSLPTDESSNAYYTMPTAQPKLLQMGCVASPRDAIAGASGTSAKNSNFVHFLFAMKYLDKAPFASATGYSFYAIHNTSTKTASICRNNCRDKTSGDLADRSVIACMCQSSANLNKSTGCFYGAKMYRNGRIEKFTSGNSRAQDCKG